MRKTPLLARGFTLIELMIVVTIVGILVAIAIPKFSYLIAKSNESSTKGNLGTIRSALAIYYGDMESWYPTDTLGGDTGSLTADQKYLVAILSAKLPYIQGTNVGHLESSDVTATTDETTDSSGWAYDNDLTDDHWGRILVSCSHSDVKGNPWSTY